MHRFILRVDGGPEHTIEASRLAEAKCEAVRFAGQLICDSADQFWDAADLSLTVTDGAGLTLFTLQLVGTEAPAIAGTR